MRGFLSAEAWAADVAAFAVRIRGEDESPFSRSDQYPNSAQGEFLTQ